MEYYQKQTLQKLGTNEATAKEKIQIEVFGSYDDNGKVVLSKLKENIEKNIQGVTVTGDDEELTVTLDGFVFTVDKNGNVIGTNETPPVIVDRTGIKIGDYINYTPDETALVSYSKNLLTDGYTGSTDNSSDLTRTDLNWQVLNINKNGSIDLIGTPTDFTVYFSGARGYNNGVYVMNDICEKLYSRTGIKARSVNLEDMEKCLTEEGKIAKANAIALVVDSLSSGKYITNINKNNNTVTYVNLRSYYPILWKEQINETEIH